MGHLRDWEDMLEPAQPPEPPTPDPGYCVHGKYVGGCGIDWMCGYCEDGMSWVDFLAMQHYHTISTNSTGQGHTADLVLKTLWETAPTCRPWVLSALAGNTVNSFPGGQYYEQFVHEELAIAHANLQLVILGMEPVK